MERSQHDVEWLERVVVHVARAVDEHVHLDRAQHAEGDAVVGVSRVDGLDPSSLVRQALRVLTVRDLQALGVVGRGHEGPTFRPGGLGHLLEGQRSVAVGAVDLEITVRRGLPRRIGVQHRADLRVGEVPGPARFGLGDGRRIVEPAMELRGHPRPDGREFGERVPVPGEFGGLARPELRGPRGTLQGEPSMGIVVAGLGPKQLAELGVGECGRHPSGALPASGPSHPEVGQLPQAHPPPQHPPALGGGAENPGWLAAPPPAPAAKIEKRRRTRSLPHSGHASWVSTEAVIERRSSNGCSHARQRYS